MREPSPIPAQLKEEVAHRSALGVDFLVFTATGNDHCG